MIKTSGRVVAFIEQERKKKKISQTDFASKLLMSRRNYQKIVAGDLNMSVSVMEAAAEILDVKVVMIDKGLLK